MKRLWTLLLLLALGFGGAVSAVHAGQQAPQPAPVMTAIQDDCSSNGAQRENGHDKASALCQLVCHAPVMAFNSLPVFQPVKQRLPEAVAALPAPLMLLSTPSVAEQPPRRV